MTYATPQLVRTALGINELTMLLGAKLSLRFDNGLIDLTINNGDRSAFTAQQQSDADAALVLLNDVINAISRTVDSYLSANYTLPLDVIVVDASPLRDIATKLVAYELYISPPEQQTNRYNAAIKQLEHLSTGKMRLAENAPAPEQKPAMISVGSTSNSTFNLDAF